MTDCTKNTNVSFKDFLFKNKNNKSLLLLSGMAALIGFALFKYFYPFASFIHGDSFSYLTAAFYNSGINTYLIGYSKFLRLFSVISSSDTALVAFQYFFIEASIVFLLFTLFYFHNINAITKKILLLFMVLNPLFLHLANLISSDNFFLATSLVWFTLLIWIIYRPSNVIITLNIIMLFITFTTRYNALIYPFITAVVLLLSNISPRRKLICIAACFLFCGTFVCYTSYKYKRLTGHWQYSPFGGWQLANNAMYAYRYVDSSNRKPVPNKFYALDKMIRQYFDTTRDVNKHPQEALKASTVYMWTRELPLFKYRDSLYAKDTTSGELKRWSSMAPLYKDYGLYIIRTYPWQFVEHFIWPNFKKYYAPPVEFLEVYNSGSDSVQDIAKVWFSYKSLRVKTRKSTKDVLELRFYPVLSGIANSVMFLTVICFLLLNGWIYDVNFRKGLALAFGLWIVNAAFTIFASSAALRFQSFPITITTIYVVLLLDWMINLMRSFDKEKSLKNSPSVERTEWILEN
ncbi:hypothetical protein [Longitalea arenae]|uniref:hypothetical protein n=1 Tax=Longitalea arenae TaxID=2812558 RepID=UPI001967DF79|nr:hypothetical protein [Longitalea arenae]